MPTISSSLQNLMLKMPMDLEEYSAFSKGQETEAVKQAFPSDQVVGKFVCFFCNEEFEGVDVLHFHQRKCSSICDIQTVLADTKSSQSKKRRFLSQLNIISKGKAEHLRLTKRHEVVVDVIVIDDSSDDEEGSIIERRSLRYLQTLSNNKKNSLSNRRLCSGKSSGGGQTRAGKFLRQSWKVFKFDISSPLGMRFRYHDNSEGDPQVPHCQGFMDYERYCCETLGISETLSLDRNYPITFRKTRHLKYTHRYKFSHRQLQKFCLKKKYGLSEKSRKLKQQMKPCFIELKKLAFCFGESRKAFDVAEVMHHQLTKSRFAFESEIVGEEMISFSDNVCEVEDMTINALLLPTAKQLCNSADVAVDWETSFVNGTSTATRGFYLNIGRTPSMHSLISPLTCPATAATDTDDNFTCRLSFGNVQFVPLSALCEQAFHDRGEREDDLCQISSVFSLAEAALPDNIHGEHCDAEGRAMCTLEKTDLSEGDLTLNAMGELMDFEPRLIQETVIFDSKSCDFSDHPASPLHHPCPNASTEAAASSSVADPAVIDLTKPLLQCGEIISKTVTRETSHSTDVAMVSGFTAPIDDVVTSLLSAGRCEIQYSQTTTQVAARPILIEIPDEDTAVAEMMCRDVCQIQPPESLTTDGVTMASSQAVSAITVSRRCDQSVSSCLLKKQVDNILERLLCDSRTVDAAHQGTVQPKKTSSIQNSDLIDLSDDSDCELMGSESLVNMQSSNTEALGLARSRPSARSLLGSSPLPPLTFRCHICHCIFEFSKDCGTLIKNHYRNHNVTNIELIKHRHPNGKVMWSLVEVNDGSALTLPPYPMNGEQNSCSGSVLQPTVTMYFPSPVANSGDENFPRENRSFAVSQTLHLGQPLSQLLLDENPLGSKGGNDSFDNCWKQRGCVATVPRDSKSSGGLASGDDGVLLQRGSRRESKQLSEGHTHSRDAGLKPRFQQNSLTRACKLPQPEFQEQSLPDCDGEKSDSRKIIGIHSTVPKAGIAMDLANSNRGKLLQRKQNYNSFSAYNNFTQSVICLD